MSNEVMLPLMEENKQYRDEFLLPLARFVIEGFIVKNLKQWAKELGIQLKEENGSLTILTKCLSQLCGIEQARKVMKPLRDLQSEKSARSSHGGKADEKNVVAKSQEHLELVTEAIIDIVQITTKKD